MTDHSHEDVKSHPVYKVTEKLLPIVVWLIITMPLWLSPFHPAVASYLILGYFVYFLYKAIKTVYYGVLSLNLMNKAERTDWLKLLKKQEGYQDYEHYILIVNYKESLTKLSHSLDAIKAQKYDLKKIHIVLGMEKREGEDAKKRAIEAEKKYGKVFGSVTSTFHIMKPNEVVGKASNAAFAARWISKDIRKRKIDCKKACVTVCDADSVLPDNYLACFTYKYMLDPDSHYRFFSAPVLLYNNFWKLPFPVRMQMTLSSVARLSYLSQDEELIQISTYSTNMWMLEKIGYWDVDIIPEDWHIWMQAFYTLGEKVKAVPIYLPIVRDGVLGPTLRKTLRTRYEQEKRWAWGASDVPYAVARFFMSKHVDFWARLRRTIFIAEVHLMWPTAFFILTISASIPTLVNPTFERTVLGFLLPKLASFILTSASILLIAAVYFDYNLRKRININTSWRQVPMLFIQWYFLPVVSFLFSSLPALEAHTRLLLGKKLEYRVTEKVG